MKSLKIAAIFVLAVITFSLTVSGAYAVQKSPDWQLHVKTVKLNETFTVGPSGMFIPEVSFDAQYNKRYLKLLSNEGNTFKLKAIKPGITFVNIICIPWYHILIYPPVDDKTITDTYIIFIKK